MRRRSCSILKITVAEARLLKNAVRDKLHDLINERNKVAFVEFEKGEEYTPHNRKFKDVTKEIQKVREHYRTVKERIAEANLQNTIEWKGEKISIVEALELVKQLRSEANSLRMFGKSQQVERITRGAFDSTIFYKKALFDPPSVKKQADKILKDANRLSILIDKANFKAVVEFDFVDEYQ